MVAWLVVLILGAITLHAHRRRRALSDRGLRRLLLLLAIALPAQALSLRFAQPVGDAVAVLPLGLAALFGVLCWTAVIHLVAQGTRRRDLFVRVPLLVFATISLVAGSPRTAAAFAALGTLRYGWKQRVPTVLLFQLGAAGLALALLTSWISPDVEPEGLQGSTRRLAELALASSIATWWHVFVGALALLGAFVRDPTLGIRRVSRRLTLSHLLVAGVPLALIALLWAFTTLLGVSQERAAVGARVLESEADRLSRSLAAAIESPGRTREALVAMATAREVDWPQLRVWWREGMRMERLAGDALDMEGALASWVDSLERLPDKGVVVLGDASFIGAARREARPSGASTAGAIALVPLVPIVSEIPTRIAGGRLEMIGAGSGSRDSLAPGRAGPRARARITAESDTIIVGDFLQGVVWVNGIRYGPSGWAPARLPLSAHAAPGEVLAGLYQRARESQLGLVPFLLLVLAAAVFLAIAVGAVMIVTGMGRSITSAIGALRTAAARLEAGDLAHRIEVKGRDELWSVADAFNTATSGLEEARQRERERQRNEAELQVARRIQSRLLPEAPPRIAGLEIAGHYDPAREVGGDYFDHLPDGEERVLLVIADVSGKSVPASLIMSAFRAALHAQSLSGVHPGELAERLNRFLHQSLDPGKFVTAFLGLLDGGTGQLRYVNAGHNPPVLLRRDGSYERLEKGGTILGILPASRYEQGEATLAPGDLVALYTDGVTEGADESGEHWGERRLVEMLRAGSGRSCADVAAAIAAEVRGFEGEQGATDDVTLLLARRRP